MIHFVPLGDYDIPPMKFGDIFVVQFTSTIWIIYTDTMMIRSPMPKNWILA